MNKVTVTYDKEANTLDVWFGSPQEAICDNLGNGVILKEKFKWRDYWIWKTKLSFRKTITRE